jgi:P27 family predicted phage terminase small subunit
MGQRGFLPNPNLHAVNGGADHRPPRHPEKLPPFFPEEPCWESFFGRKRLLCRDASTEWNTTVKELIGRGKITRLDVTGVTDMCIVQARLLECERSLSARGLVVKGATGPVKNPASTILNQMRTAMQRYRVEYGLSSSTRMRIGEEEPTPPDDDSDLDDPGS